MDLITSARVSTVHPDKVCYTSKGHEGQVVEHAIPTNFVLWSTGIAMNPFTARVSSLLWVEFGCYVYAALTLEGNHLDRIRFTRKPSRLMHILELRALLSGQYMPSAMPVP